MRQFGLVFGYSFMERVRSKAFRVMTVIMILILAALIILPKFLGEAQNMAKGDIAILDTAGIVTETEGFRQQVSDSYNWRVIQEADLAKEKAELEKEGEVLGIVTIGEKDSRPVLTVTVNKMDDAADYLSPLNSYVQNLYTLSEMNRLELAPQDKAKLTAAVQVEVQELKVGSKSITATYWPIYLIMFLLYLLIYFFGANVATSISVEKGSRVKEILITKVKPIQLLYGKVLGVGLAGLLQFSFVIGAAYLMMTLSGSGSNLELFGFQIDFSILEGKTVALLIVFFILGYFFYAALFAAAGSLVSRSEEINQVTLPISLFLMAGLLFGVFNLADADSSAAVIGSYVPFVTPFMMFIRVGMSDPTWLEILLPTLVLFLSTLGACWLSAKVYQVGVLLYGQKPTPKLIYKAMRSL
ncbi:ABC transporter permease [Paenibacillus sp. DYY-L-2]|uniref:ABC transporter permease n=1 Tax=Paenibacillus sp. DYY-L-2 TaxID=3447013 RepID=UPI003F4FA1B3